VIDESAVAEFARELSDSLGPEAAVNPAADAAANPAADATADAEAHATADAEAGVPA